MYMKDLGYISMYEPTIMSVEERDRLEGAKTAFN